MYRVYCRCAACCLPDLSRSLDAARLSQRSNGFDGCAGAERHLNDVHISIPKSLGILLHFSKHGRVAARQVQLCLLVLHMSTSSVLRRGQTSWPEQQVSALTALERIQTLCGSSASLGVRAWSGGTTAKAIAMARPIPEVAPVIRADLPCRSAFPFPTMLL